MKVKVYFYFHSIPTLTSARIGPLVFITILSYFYFHDSAIKVKILLKKINLFSLFLCFEGFYEKIDKTNFIWPTKSAIYFFLFSDTYISKSYMYMYCEIVKLLT